MKPKTYKKSEHKIPKEEIDKNAIYIVEKLKEHNFQAYIVGGSVRDLLIKESPKDFDISTNAHPEEIKKVFPRALLIGKRFRLAHIRFARNVYEVSTFRKGDNEAEKMIESDNLYGNEKDDVLRRDFTMNGLFYDPTNETVIDYVDGVLDVKNHYLQSIGVPYKRFMQDPVRMIRAIKFKARFGFEFQKEITQAIVDCRDAITDSAPARVLEELLRMLESSHSKEFILLLKKTSLLEKLLPAYSSHLENNQASLHFLACMDEALQDKELHISRSILVACLVFPICVDHLENLYSTAKKRLNLGIIQKECEFILKDFFHPFLRLPKRIYFKVLAILSHQFRFTPLDSPTHIKIRMANCPYFSYAMHFFEIRSQLDEKLDPLFKQWKYYYDKKKSTMPEPKDPHKRRYRRKRHS
jgi:poly(A) polymerase